MKRQLLLALLLLTCISSCKPYNRKGAVLDRLEHVHLLPFPRQGYELLYATSHFHDNYYIFHVMNVSEKQWLDITSSSVDLSKLEKERAEYEMKIIMHSLKPTKYSSINIMSSNVAMRDLKEENITVYWIRDTNNSVLFIAFM